MKFVISSLAFDAELEPADLTKQLRPSLPIVKLLTSLSAFVLAAVMLSMTEVEIIESVVGPISADVNYSVETIQSSLAEGNQRH